jgi:hypothetical protein
MNPRNTYKFSVPAAHIDFQRIVREARETAIESDDFETLPDVIRVNLEGGHVVTLCHRETLIGALLNQKDAVVTDLLEANCISVNDECRFTTIGGSDGILGQDAAYTHDTDWVAFQGDFVKELTNRREVSVEVF